MLNIRARRRQILEASLEKLLKDYEAAINQRDMVPGQVERNRLEREAAAIWQDIEKLNNDLESQEIEPADDTMAISKTEAASIQNKLRSKLHAMDFKQVEETIRVILRDHQEGGCAALLLFQESDNRGGYWCAARIRELLQRETHEGGFREIPVGFKAYEQANSMELMRRIGQDLGIESTGQDVIELSQRVVQTLCGLLRNGSIVMIRCERCDDICHALDEFRRVLEDFWSHLVNALSRVSADCCEVKVITLLFTDKPLPDDCLVGYCCTIEQFQKDKVLKLPQEEWSQEDIRAWIARYSGLALSPAQINLMAKNIYDSAGGLPLEVEYKLLKACCPAIAG